MRRSYALVWLGAVLVTGSALAQSPAPALRHFSERASETSAVAFQLGDRFTGPGALSFGRLGARRQIVLPEGEWVALAAADWQTPLMSSQTIAGVQATLSTVVFGRFEGTRLVSMLRFTANSRPAPTLTTGAIGSTWPDAARCDTPAPTRLFHERLRPDPFREDCWSIGVLPDALADPLPAQAQAKQSLDRLGATAAGAAAVATISYSEMRRHGYLGIVRVDWPQAGSGLEPDGAFVQALQRWAADYRKTALEGYRSDYPGADLRALTATK